MKWGKKMNPLLPAEENSSIKANETGENDTFSAADAPTALPTSRMWERCNFVRKMIT